MIGAEIGASLNVASVHCGSDSVYDCLAAGHSVRLMHTSLT